MANMTQVRRVNDLSKEISLRCSSVNPSLLSHVSNATPDRGTVNLRKKHNQIGNFRLPNVVYLEKSVFL